MRKPFIETLTKLAEKDPRVILIIGDVGFSFIEGFKERFPNQFLNTGACEQTMMGIAAGMAQQGWKPYVYTMSNFILSRPHEQLRNDIGFGKANVKLISVKGSAAYKFLGYSHNLQGEVNVNGLHTTEEVALLATIPNLKTYFPRTDLDAVTYFEEEYKREGPAYFSI